jgi:hypothetical protein
VSLHRVRALASTDAARTSRRDARDEEAPTLDYFQKLLGTGYAQWLVRVVGAIVCFALAAVLTVAPGPAFVFWILGLVLLGVSVGQVLLALHAVQDWLHARVPFADRLPRFRKAHIRTILRNRWVRTLERISEQRERRRVARAQRRAERARRR